MTKYPDKSNLGYKGFIFAYIQENTVCLRGGNMLAGRRGTVARAGGWLVMPYLPSESRALNAHRGLAPSLHLHSLGPQSGNDATHSGWVSHLKEHSLENPL